MFFAIVVYLITLWWLIVQFKKDKNLIITSHSHSMKFLIGKINQNSTQNTKNKKYINDILKKMKQQQSLLDANIDQNFATHKQLRDEIRINESKINHYPNPIVEEELIFN